MIHIGMIYQYSDENSSGLIMFSDGMSKTFTKDDWNDKNTAPGVGQKVTYAETSDGVEVQVASEDNISKTVSSKEEKKSIEEYLEHFTSLGFKCIKDTNTDSVRVLTLRSFATGESEEVIIKENNSNITVVQTMNGKVVS